MTRRRGRATRWSTTVPLAGLLWLAGLPALDARAAGLPPPAGLQVASRPQEPQVPASPPEQAQRPNPPPRDRIAARQAEVRAELEAARQALEAAKAGGAEPPASLVREVDLLARLDLLYGQQLAVLEEGAALATNRDQLRRDLETQRTRGPSEESPRSFLLLENLRAELQAHAGRSETIAAGIEADREALEADTRTRDEKEAARRSAREAAEADTDPGHAAARQVELRLAQLDSRAAAEQVRLREFQLANHDLDREIHDLRVTKLREDIERIAEDATFTRKDLDEILARIDNDEFTLTRKLEWGRHQLTSREQIWAEARRRLDDDPAPSRALVEEVEARRLAHQALSRQITLLTDRLARLADTRATWNRRFETFNRIASRKEMRGWWQESRESLRTLDREIRLETNRLKELHRERLTVQGKADATEDAEAKRWLRRQEAAFDEWIDTFETNLHALEEARRLEDKLREDLAPLVETRTLGERIEAVAEGIARVWNYEITTIDDRPITVSKVVVALLLLVLGYGMSRSFSRALGKQLLPRLKVPQAPAAAIQTLTHYLLLLLFALFALRIVNVPLTAFTLLGGAFAIGVGFGSQNIINNFISGLILLAERPIKVGDLVDVDGVYGTIEAIGARSTRVRTFDNTHVIVPNSSFLEKNVLNWTLSDDRIRAVVRVGVAYGSPTREVAKLMRKAAGDHGRVLKFPEPFVVFRDFGDDALLFEVFFWIRMRTMKERWTIESDLRFQIDSLFRAARITIAYPQRDVHLDAARPVPVRVVAAEAAPDDAGAPAGG